MLGMFPAVLLALPLLLPVNPILEQRVDILSSAPTSLVDPSNVSAAPFAPSGRVIPPLYEQPDGGFSLLLSPGSPCTAACLRLQGRF
jgi:hypothetical protein